MKWVQKKLSVSVSAWAWLKSSKEAVARTTNACSLWGGTEIKLDTKTLAELRRLDAGSWFDARFAGTPIPTLAEALAVMKSGKSTGKLVLTTGSGS